MDVCAIGVCGGTLCGAGVCGRGVRVASDACTTVLLSMPGSLQHPAAASNKAARKHWLQPTLP